MYLLTINLPLWKDSHLLKWEYWLSHHFVMPFKLYLFACILLVNFSNTDWFNNTRMKTGILQRDNIIWQSASKGILEVDRKSHWNNRMGDADMRSHLSGWLPIIPETLLAIFGILYAWIANKHTYKILLIYSYSNCYYRTRNQSVFHMCCSVKL